MNTPRWKIVLFACLFAGVVGTTAKTGQAGSPEETLENSRRILFLGDSITYDGRYVSYFEAWLASTYPDRQYEVLNVGLPSETVSGLSEEGHAGGAFPRPDLQERLDRVLAATRPDLVIACYGINCGIYQPFDETRFQAYRNGVKRLRKAVLKQGGQIVWVTPPTYDTHGAENEIQYDAVLGAYSDWLLSMRDSGWLVVNLHAQMREEIRERREEKPAFTFQPDRIHPDSSGHEFMARQLIDYFGESSTAADGTGIITNPALYENIHNRMTLLRNAWLTHTGHTRPGIATGKSLEEAGKKAKTLSVTIQTIIHNHQEPSS